jgi:curved DNA-binding protein CbpA
MKDLYEILDVPKTADKAAIHRAYRSKAKKAHPDNQETGSAESFALVKLAHDILGDAERRAKYDATGDCSEKSPDNAFAEAMNLVSTALDEVMADIAKNSGVDFITSFNLVSRMKYSLEKYKQSARDNKTNIERIRAVNQRLVRRFKRRHKSDEPNLLEAMIAGRITSCAEQIAFQDRNLKAADKAIEILMEYEFEVERAKTHPPPPVMSLVDSILRGNFLGG